MWRGGGPPQRSNSGRGVEDYLGSIHAVHEPVQRVVASEADVHSYLAKLCLEHLVACVALHVVGGLGERRIEKCILIVGGSEDCFFIN